MPAQPLIDDRTMETIRRASLVAGKGDFDEACAIGASGLEDGGDPAALHAMLGWFRLRSGQIEAAIEHLEEAHSRRPADPIVVRNLASALAECKRFADVLQVVSEAAVMADSGRHLLRLRGYAAQMTGDAATAVCAYERVLVAEPADWESWNNLGNVLADDADFGRAESALRQAVLLNPGSFGARMNLARILRRAGRLPEAAAELRRSAADFPAETEALAELADLLSEMGDDRAAERALAEAVERQPGNPELLVSLGRQQLFTLDLAAAEASFRRAWDLEPGSSGAFLGLADALEHGRPDALPVLVAEAEKTSVASPALNLVKAISAQRQRQYLEGLAALRSVPQEFVPERRWQVEGQLCDAAALYDEAFAAFIRMNAAQAAGPGEPLRRAAELRHLLRSQLASTTEAWRDTWKAPLDPIADAPVFLVGFPRSGTTLLDTLLMGHSRIQVMEELPVLARLEVELGGFGAIAGLDADAVDKARRRYFEIVSDHIDLRPGALLVDKSPLHLQRVPQIVRFFPGARFILAMRHPADAVLGCFMANFRLNPAMANFLELETAAEFYDLTFAMWEASRELFPIEFHAIAYEELVDDPEAVLKPVVEALGLPWEEAILYHQRTARSRGAIPTASYAQVGRPIYKSAVGRWRHYRKHLEPVLPMLEPWIRKFGYSI